MLGLCSACQTQSVSFLPFFYKTPPFLLLPRLPSLLPLLLSTNRLHILPRPITVTPTLFPPFFVLQFSPSTPKSNPLLNRITSRCLLPLLVMGLLLPAALKPTPSKSVPLSRSLRHLLLKTLPASIPLLMPLSLRL